MLTSIYVLILKFQSNEITLYYNYNVNFEEYNIL